MICAVCGEPLSQTAQSFMPELLYGVSRSLEKVSVTVTHSLILKDLSSTSYIRYQFQIFLLYSVVFHVILEDNLSFGFEGAQYLTQVRYCRDGKSVALLGKSSFRTQVGGCT